MSVVESLVEDVEGTVRASTSSRDVVAGLDENLDEKRRGKTRSRMPSPSSLVCEIFNARPSTPPSCSSKGYLPSAHSHRVMPSDQMSAARPYGERSTRSGLMYRSDPLNDFKATLWNPDVGSVSFTEPTPVRACVPPVSSLARVEIERSSPSGSGSIILLCATMPKSVILHTPVRRTSTFPGLMSRCTSLFFSCRYSSPAATCAQTPPTTTGGIARPARFSALSRLPPSANSSATHTVSRVLS